MRKLFVISALVLSSACGSSWQEIAAPSAAPPPRPITTQASAWGVSVLGTTQFAGGTEVTATTTVGSLPVLDPVLTFCRLTATGVARDTCDSEATGIGSQTFRIVGDGPLQGYLTSGVPDVATLPRGAIAATVPVD